MIKTLSIQNYKALQDVTLELTPIHALIGPNDSGKTSILNALAALSRSTELSLKQAFDGAWEGRELVWHGDASGVVRFIANLVAQNSELSYTLACRFPEIGRNVVVHEEKIEAEAEIACQSQNQSLSQVAGVSAHNHGATEAVGNACRLVHDLIAGVHYYRWNPRMLALPVAADSTRRFRMKPDGFGLALMLDDILGYDRELFGRLEHKFRSIFPEIASIKLIRQPAFRSPADEREQVSRIEQADGKGLYLELKNGRQVPAAQASDGLLLILAYLTVLLSPEPPRLILVEEPENGIHPRRLREVIQILRGLVAEQSRTQVLLTTHSPHVVDLLEKNEVTLCTKDSTGAVNLTRMADTQSVRDQLSIFTLGEIWTAEGDEDLAKDHAATGT
jgi:predicted ATPase